MTALPLDPMDYDRIPPEDLDACDRCSGQGVVEHAGRDLPCGVCGGTGTLAGVA